MAKRGVVARLVDHLGDDVLVEAAGVGEALPVADDDPHADALRLGRRQRLDLALVGPHLGVARPADDRLDLLAVVGPGDDAVGDVEQVARHAGAGADAHAAVPPTVSRATRRVGTPSPTGTPWPSLPHVPGRAHGEVVAPARRCPAAPSARCR